MVFGEGGGFWLDQAKGGHQGSGPDVLVDWALIIERTPKQACEDSRGALVIISIGVVDGA
jgi:hypothetical protein